MQNSKNKKRTFLATTAMNEFWDTTKPLLFLGEWCKTYKNKIIWADLDHETLVAPLIDQNPNDVLNSVLKTYHILLQKISKWLNKTHHCTHSQNYWEIVAGTFLFTFIQTVFDRFLRLKAAYSEHPALTTIRLSENAFRTPYDEGEFYLSSMMNDAINLQMITQLISIEFDSPSSYKKYSWENEKSQNEKKFSSSDYRLITKIKIHFLWLLVRLRGKKTVAVIAAHGFGKKTLWKLMRSSFFSIIPLSPKIMLKKEYIKLSKVNINASLRSELLDLQVDDYFSKVILKMLTIHMPLSFIENYSDICAISKKQYPHYAKVVFGAPPIGNESLKLWIARHKEKGVKQIGWQHGAGYGVLDFYSIEFVEHKFSDRFVSWGMKSNGKVISAPSIPICLQIEASKNKMKLIRNNKEIIWIATEFMRYPFAEIRHSVNASQAEKLYYENQCELLGLLDSSIFEQIIMRLRYTGWSDNWKRVEHSFPTLRLHKPTDRSSFYEQIRSAKLLLFDNFNTTHYYGLALNIPTILVWDEKKSGIKDEFKCYFDALCNAGIYHSTLKSAANMINKIGNNPFEWWSSDAVQSIRLQYTDFFTQASDDWLIKWKNILLNLRSI